MKMSKQNTCDSIIKDTILQVSGVLSRKFKARLRDSQLDAIWRPKIKKICVQVLNCESWLFKTLTGPIATSEIVIYYALSKLTKPSDKLF